MKIAIATDDFERVSGHAGQATRWLLYDCAAGGQAGPAQRISLDPTQVFHHWEDRGPHPLDGVELIVARSAGDGFLRRMQKRGVEVLLTGEERAEQAITRVLAGDALPPPGWDASLLFCRLRDLFSKH
jgi:predicted Fe-Mo cluster-binding NifX family protein